MLLSEEISEWIDNNPWPTRLTEWAEMAGKLERDLAKTRLLAEAWEECAKTMNEHVKAAQAIIGAK